MSVAQSAEQNLPVNFIKVHFKSRPVLTVDNDRAGGASAFDVAVFGPGREVEETQILFLPTGLALPGHCRRNSIEKQPCRGSALTMLRGCGDSAAA